MKLEVKNGVLYTKDTVIQLQDITGASIRTHPAKKASRVFNFLTALPIVPLLVFESSMEERFRVLYRIVLVYALVFMAVCFITSVVLDLIVFFSSGKRYVVVNTRGGSLVIRRSFLGPSCEDILKAIQDGLRASKPSTGNPNHPKSSNAS